MVMNKTTKITTFQANLYGQVFYFSMLYPNLKDRGEGLLFIASS